MVEKTAKDIVREAAAKHRRKAEDNWEYDTGSYENVNAEVARRLIRNIKKHPILWKLFFMVA